MRRIPALASQTEAQATENGRVSSDIMDNNGTEFRIAGIVDTGGKTKSSTPPPRTWPNSPVPSAAPTWSNTP